MAVLQLFYQHKLSCWIYNFIPFIIDLLRPKLLIAKHFVMRLIILSAIKIGDGLKTDALVIGIIKKPAII